MTRIQGITAVTKITQAISPLSNAAGAVTGTAINGTGFDRAAFIISGGDSHLPDSRAQQLGVNSDRVIVRGGLMHNRELLLINALDVRFGTTGCQVERLRLLGQRHIHTFLGQCRNQVAKGTGGEGDASVLDHVGPNPTTDSNLQVGG